MMKMETPGSHCSLVIQRLDARIDQDRLLVSAPVQVSHAATASQLDQAIDALLEDVGTLLELTLSMAQARVAESWASDAAGEPLAAISEQLLELNALHSQIHAHWSLESPLGFPEDEQWLELLVRRALEARGKK